MTKTSDIENSSIGVIDIKGVKPSTKPLKPNPFNVYRDEQTGTWIVIRSPGIG